MRGLSLNKELLYLNKVLQKSPCSDWCSLYLQRDTSPEEAAIQRTIGSQARGYFLETILLVKDSGIWSLLTTKEVKWADVKNNEVSSETGVFVYQACLSGCCKTILVWRQGMDDAFFCWVDVTDVQGKRRHPRTVCSAGTALCIACCSRDGSILETGTAKLLYLDEILGKLITITYSSMISHKWQRHHITRVKSSSC